MCVEECQAKAKDTSNVCLSHYHYTNATHDNNNICEVKYLQDFDDFFDGFVLNMMS